MFTGAAGDEPAGTLELISFAQSCGFEIVAAGKGKNNAAKIRRHAGGVRGRGARGAT